MNAMARFGGLLLCALALLAWPAGSAHAGFDEVRPFTDFNGTRGVFSVKFEGEDLRVDKVTCTFKKDEGPITGLPPVSRGETLTLRNWHVRIRFLDSNGKEYARFDQKNQPGPSNKGDFVWRPPKGFKLKPASRGNPGKAQIFLIEQREGKEKELARVEGDIFQR